MKHKRLAYILLPVVLLIWGIIFYRIWASVKQEEPALAPGATVAVVAPRTVAEAATPRLKLTYPDPFLSAAHPVVLPQAEQEMRVAATVAPPIIYKPFRPSTLLPSSPTVAPAPVIWPLVEYVGAIENQRKHTRVAMLNINGSHYLLREKEKQSALQVETIFKDSVQVRFQQQRRVVYRLASK